MEEDYISFYCCAHDYDRNLSTPWPGRKWWDFQLCVDGTCSDKASKLHPCTSQYQNPNNSTLLETCAKSTGFDYAKLSACATGSQGAALMQASSDYTSEQGVKYGNDGLPVVRVNGKQISKFWARRKAKRFFSFSEAQN